MTSFSQDIPEYQWDEVVIKKQISPKLSTTKYVHASDILGGMPVYVSMATMSDRINLVSNTLKSIFAGDIVPTHVYVMISSDPYLKDSGIPRDAIPSNLVKIAEKKPVSIIYTENIGPHRKLLPILAKFWNQKCIIVTLDDDVVYHKSTLAELIKCYILSGQQSVIALRSRRISLCVTNQALSVSDYVHWPVVSYGTREMLQLPTGTGGVLYRPDFFDPIVFDRNLLSVTLTGDDILFRLACIIKHIAVVTACRIGQDTGSVPICPDSYPIITPGGESKEVPELGGRRLARKVIIPNLKNNNKNNTSLVGLRSSRKGNVSSTSATGIAASSSSPKKKSGISLWSLNKGGRNDLMWHDAVKYIERTLDINFFAIFNYYYLKERNDCAKVNATKAVLCGVVEECDSYLKTANQT